jgi:hypothetical protein
VFNCFCFYQYYKEKDIFIAAGMETYLSVYKNHLEDLVAEFHSTDGVSIQSMIVSRQIKLLFCGTSIGTVRIYPWPFIEELFEFVPLDAKSVRFKLPDCHETQIHSLPITSLVISHDQKYLICGVEDGSIVTLGINVRWEEGDNGLMQKQEDRVKMTGLINDMMFIHQSRITEMNENIKKLNFEVVKSE